MYSAGGSKCDYAGHDKQFYNNLGIGTSVLCGDCCWMIAHANIDYTLTVLPIAH